jgi:hypothetical protein
MAKVKITKKEAPYLKRDLDIDESVLKRLEAVQAEFQEKHQKQIEAARKGALERYTSKLKSLEKDKEEAIRKYDREIERYKALVKELKGVKKPGEQKEVKTGKSK